ncbi:MAG: hypothetical protein V2J24_23150 [Pseudomonadales bacterium]|nr:hypothetical protein [Pseudomonadales bacterium]
MWTMIFLVVLVGCAYSAFEAWLKHRTKAARVAPADDRLRAELDELRTRLQTLEAIVTDDGYDLKRRIDDLEPPRSRSVG